MQLVLLRVLPDLLQDRFDLGGKTHNIAIQLILQQCCKTSCTFFVARFSVPKRAYSHDVTAFISVFQNNETAAMLVIHANPVGVELFPYVNASFCSNSC